MVITKINLLLKISGLSLVLMYLALSLPQTARALTGSQGTIEVDLEMTPPDPIAGESLSLAITFRDRAKYFTLERCRCQLLVRDSKRTIIYQTPLLQDPTYIREQIPNIIFTFPRIDTYTFQIAGTSTNAVFEPFQISIEQKVEKKHVAPWMIKTKNWFRQVLSDFLPLLFALIVLPLGWKFLVVGKKKRR